MDLLDLSKNCFSVLRQKAGELLHRPLHRKPAEYLYILAEIMVDEQRDFDGILLGSSFDPYPSIVEKFHNLGPKVYANSAENFALARDILRVQKIAKESGFKVPETIPITNLSQLLDVARKQSFPLITRGEGGGGGHGIKIWENSQQLASHFEQREEFPEKLWIQEYIDGIDASASVICFENFVNVLSINQQLIGDKNLGAPGRFSYCGNIVPLDQKHIQKTLEEELLDSIKKLFQRLDLRGSNGIDFVIKDNEFFFMEINPRFQGSLECVQFATRQNLVELHLDSFHNNAPSSIPGKPKYYTTAVKGILFSNSEEKFQVIGYPKNKWIVDRTHLGVLLEYGDPFCSIVLSANSAKR
ncbi:MAG: ATP-grasp domain-containing protein, partial [Candidatus Heimdallarchaeota archaeon]|nr:ATP-grasp domain-containing protein [Candidatus Heimdallarchaeota archaeon]